MRELETTVRKYMGKMNMLRPGDHVLAGVSGGADSVCLLRILAALREEMRLTVTVCHVEHGIRGADSLADMAFVQELCGRLGISCICRRVDAGKKAAAEGLSLEEAARLLRYEALEEAADTAGADAIALAHHMEDNAETILFHLVRGSGIQGLTGIPAVRGRIIRPLLEVSRGEIEAYLKAAGQDWRQDETNTDLYYARNRIREKVLPELAEVNAGAARHLTDTAKRLQTVWDYLEESAEEALRETAAAGDEGWFVDTARFRGLHPALQERVIHRLLEDAGGSRKDLGAVHIGIVKDLLLGDPGRAADLPYGLRAIAEQGRLRLYRKGQTDFSGKTEEATDELMPDLPLWIGGEGNWQLPGGARLTCRILEFDGDLAKIPVKTYTKWFDYDKIKNRLCVRSRRPGDYLTVNEAGGQKKLKNWMIDEKIPSGERGRILLLADESHILWVIGRRISASYKVSGSTRRVLEVSFYSEGVTKCMK